MGMPSRRTHLPSSSTRSEIEESERAWPASFESSILYCFDILMQPVVRLCRAVRRP